jgi:hypothetical protein
LLVMGMIKAHVSKMDVVSETNRSANLLALTRSKSGNRVEGVVLNARFTGSHVQTIADAVGKAVAMNGSLTDREAN